VKTSIPPALLIAGNVEVVKAVDTVVFTPPKIEVEPPAISLSSPNVQLETIKTPKAEAVVMASPKAQIIGLEIPRYESPKAQIMGLEIPKYESPKAQTIIDPAKVEPPKNKEDMGILSGIIKGVGKVVGGIANKIKENKSNAIQVAALELVNTQKAQQAVFPASTMPAQQAQSPAQAAAFAGGLNAVDYEIKNKQSVPVWLWPVAGLVALVLIVLLLKKK